MSRWTKPVGPGSLGAWLDPGNFVQESEMDEYIMDIRICRGDMLHGRLFCRRHLEKIGG